MFAVIKIGSSQFRVSEGDVIRPNRLKEEKGVEMTLDQVLLLSDGATVRVGNPYLGDVKVQAEVVDHMGGDKVVAFKYRLRKSSSRKRGYRQKLTALQIKRIVAGA
ncbi:MAG TPA: 50S ribosomal protein L21 [Candidatus Omnitrophota bacterium]|nr:50S ribosomal protein L21 [Candidatus Omnitrophota bacterium]HPB68149.1 50S ribosomal protein L21 [Candidatus Omnitrophota bacterium]HQO57097.1 50S ribosomal protein L21 [Candidatus Omnitrophota bacterium]HQP11215.1 50S ribosomal protein L21 [Candidatus Omnitrophota bacterium]